MPPAPAPHNAITQQDPLYGSMTGDEVDDGSLLSDDYYTTDATPSVSTQHAYRYNYANLFPYFDTLTDNEMKVGIKNILENRYRFPIEVAKINIQIKVGVARTPYLVWRR